jgi:hypothetical protein
LGGVFENVTFDAKKSEKQAEAHPEKSLLEGSK